jgi:hypothetical protein
MSLATGLNDLLDARIRYYTTHFNYLTVLARYNYFEGTIYKYGLQR